jgi:hypothetical protein
MSETSSASEVINQNLGIFGRGMIKAAFPNKVDGLKPVHRRILAGIMDKKGVVHSPRLVSDTAELHPHGESSIYNAAVRLGQAFEYNPPMLDFRSESSSGTYPDPKPGSTRYTSLRVPEFFHDLYFKNVEWKALPKELDELLISYEAIYFVPTVPTTLLYANKTIGYGFASYTAPHNLGDVCDLVVAFAQHKKTSPILPFDYVKHAEKFLPDFPVYGILTNADELVDAYRNGDFNRKICLDGNVRLTSDSIIISTLPYGTSFKELEGIVQELMSGKDNKGGWFDKNLLSVRDISNAHDVGECIVRVKRGVNVFEAWELLRKKIKFSGTVTPIPNYNDEGLVVSISQPNLLDIWYQVRYNTLISSKKIRLMSLTKSKREVEALLIVVDHRDEVVKILSGNSRRGGVEALMNRFDLTDFQATHISDSAMHTLSTTSKESLITRRDTLDNQLNELRESFGTIPDEIARDALALKKKYNTPRRTRIPEYLGYVRIGGGCIQYETFEEIAQIIEDFPKVEMEIHTYDGSHLYKVSEGGKLERGSIPKITTGDIYGLKSNSVITVNISDGTACCVKGFVPGLRQEGYFYTTPKSRAIYRNGDIKVITVEDEISVRKTICRGANTNIIYVYPDIKQDHYVIALNTATPNVIVIQKVSADRSKIPMSTTGEVMVLHSVDKHIFLNVPQKFLNRNTTRVVEIVDAEKVLEGKDQIRLDIASAKVKSSKLIRLL